MAVANDMTRRGRDVDIVACRSAGPLIDDVAAEVGLVDLGAARVLTAIPEFVRYLRRTEVDAVISVMDHTNLVCFGALRLAQSRPLHIATVHSDYGVAMRQYGLIRRTGLKAALRFCYPRIDHVVGVSNAVATQIRALVGAAANVRVIHNPVPFADVARQAAEPLGSIEASEGPTVASMGRLVANKGMDDVIRAFAEARRRREMRLLVIGTGPELDNLKALAAELDVADEVTFTGFLANPFPLLSRCDLYVSGSISEGFGVAIAEALALKLPVVATDCPGGVREVVDEGRLATLVPVHEPQKMAGAMLDALEHGRPADDGALSYLRQFDLPEVTDRYLRLIDDEAETDV